MSIEPGNVGWFDLTVEDAPRLRDFYREVIGWSVRDVDMGGYADYAMVPPGSKVPIAGVCHARGVNVGLPAQWLAYIRVANLDASIAAATRLGGRTLAGPRGNPASGCFAVIEDPAGAVMALMQQDAPGA